MANALRRCFCGFVSSCSRAINPFLLAGHGLRYRKLEVILTTTMNNLGKAGETVKVAPGYFRNYLMPNMLAVPNIPKFAFLIREQRKLYQRDEEEQLKTTSKVKEETSQESQMNEYEMAAKRLYNGLLNLRRHIKVDNELQEPVTKKDLVAEVARQLCVNIHPTNIHLPSPISSLGEYQVILRLPREIPRPEGLLHWTINVKIRKK